MFTEEPRDTRSEKKARIHFKKNARAVHASTVLLTPPEHALRGILIAIHKNRVEIATDTERYEATLAPELLKQGASDFAVGDRVFFDISSKPLLLGRMERTSFITRTRSDRTRTNITQHILAANIDVGVITVSGEDLHVFSQFIERSFVLLEDGGVLPVICVTKCDIPAETAPLIAIYRAKGISVLETSCVQGTGIEELKALLLQKTAVFIGQSGVGKSSLIRMFMPNAVIATGEVNKKTGKGTHTTTASTLYCWAKDSYIIDTPGVRSLGTENIPKTELRTLFPEFFELAIRCKYHDCLHLEEPRCAVRDALKKDPGLGGRRYAGYLRMMYEK